LSQHCWALYLSKSSSMGTLSSLGLMRRKG